jgi:hypothetical protein
VGLVVVLAVAGVSSAVVVLAVLVVTWGGDE